MAVGWWGIKKQTLIAADFNLRKRLREVQSFLYLVQNHWKNSERRYLINIATGHNPLGLNNIFFYQSDSISSTQNKEPAFFVRPKIQQSSTQLLNNGQPDVSEQSKSTVQRQSSFRIGSALSNLVLSRSTLNSIYAYLDS